PNLEEIYNLEDALVVALQLNAFIRHAITVKMANIAQIVNVIAPIFTRPDGHFLQTIFFPFEVYSKTCGQTALDVRWESDTFTSQQYGSVRCLDVAATINTDTKQLAVYVVNRSQTDALETTFSFVEGRVGETVEA